MGTFIVIAVAVWAVTAGAYLLLSRRLRSADVNRMKSRLLGAGKKRSQKKEATAALIAPTEPEQSVIVRRMLHRLKLTERLKELIEQAGEKHSVARLIHACMACFLAAYAAGWLLMPPEWRMVLLLPACLAGSLPYLLLLRKKASRLKRFEELFPDSLEFVARSMRAGHAFSVALEMIHKEFQEPLAGEFRRTFDEHNLGLPLEVALQKLAKRVPSLDVHFFVSAVILQKRTGGNLAEILDKLAHLIRERFKLRGKIKAISAHGRMTGMALSSIPIGVAVLLLYANPDYVKFFFSDEVGNIMLGGAVFLQILGYVVMQKIVKIEV